MSLTDNEKTDLLVVSGGVAGGLLTWQLLDLGSGWAEQLFAFFVGAIPAAMATSVAMTDAATKEMNVVLLTQSFAFAKEAPLTYAMIAIGTTAALGLFYHLLLAPEFNALLAFFPFLRMAGIDVAIMWLGVMSTVIWGGILGWPIEVIEWVLGGAKHDAIPKKPSGRTTWHLTDLPKDLFYLIFAAPIAVLDDANYAITNTSYSTLVFLPVKIASDQFSRLGDIIIDIFQPTIVHTVEGIAKHVWNAEASIVSKTAGFLDDAFNWCKHEFGDAADRSKLDLRLANPTQQHKFVFNAKDYPKRIPHPSHIDKNPYPEFTGPVKSQTKNFLAFWGRYPLLFSPGDNYTVTAPSSSSS